MADAPAPSAAAAAPNGESELDADMHELALQLQAYEGEEREDLSDGEDEEDDDAAAAAAAAVTATASEEKILDGDEDGKKKPKKQKKLAGVPKETAAAAAGGKQRRTPGPRKKQKAAAAGASASAATAATDGWNIPDPPPLPATSQYTAMIETDLAMVDGWLKDVIKSAENALESPDSLAEIRTRAVMAKYANALRNAVLMVNKMSSLYADTHRRMVTHVYDARLRETYGNQRGAAVFQSMSK